MVNKWKGTGKGCTRPERGKHEPKGFPGAKKLNNPNSGAGGEKKKLSTQPKSAKCHAASGRRHGTETGGCRGESAGNARCLGVWGGKKRGDKKTEFDFGKRAGEELGLRFLPSVTAKREIYRGRQR